MSDTQTGDEKSVDSFYLADKGMVSLKTADSETLRRIIQIQQDTIRDMDSFVAEGSDDDPGLIRAAKQNAAEISALRHTFIAALQSGAIGQDAFSGFKVGVELMNSIRMETAAKLVSDLKARRAYEQGESDYNPSRIKITILKPELRHRIARGLAAASVIVLVFTLAGVAGNLALRLFGW
jgi:hypothetical protein